MERAMEARELPGKFIAGCTAVFALAMAAAALSAAADYGPAGLFGWALCIAAFSAVFAAALWAQSRLPGRALLPVIFAAALLLRLPFALLPDEAQSSDFALLYSAAQGLAAGDASALSGHTSCAGATRYPSSSTRLWSYASAAAWRRSECSTRCG